MNCLPNWQIGDQWLYTFVHENLVKIAQGWLLRCTKTMAFCRYPRKVKPSVCCNQSQSIPRQGDHDGLSVYENGEPQPVFNFPWAVGNTWVLPCLANNGLQQPITSTMVRSSQRPQVMDTVSTMSLAVVKVSSKHWFGQW